MNAFTIVVGIFTGSLMIMGGLYSQSPLILAVGAVLTPLAIIFGLVKSAGYRGASSH